MSSNWWLGSKNLLLVFLAKKRDFGSIFAILKFCQVYLSREKFPLKAVEIFN